MDIVDKLGKFVDVNEANATPEQMAIAKEIERKTGLFLQNKTHYMSPQGYADFAARLSPAEYDGIQINISFKPDAIWITLGNYGMSSTTLDTVRQKKLKPNASKAQIMKAFMDVLGKKK